MTTYKKLTINLSEDVYEQLSDLAEQRAITITELIKRAVALDKYVWEHRYSELLLKDGDNVQQIVMFK
jgi:predicted transcriptional regulator